MSVEHLRNTHCKRRFFGGLFFRDELFTPDGTIPFFGTPNGWMIWACPYRLLSILLKGDDSDEFSKHYNRTGSSNQSEMPTARSRAASIRTIAKPKTTIEQNAPSA